MASLQVIKGPNVGTVYELTASESVMGRYPFCDVVLPSHTISRQHARIVRVDEKYYVEDMNSLNGTFLNGERVRGRVPLKDQDRIRLYEILLLFHMQTISAPPEGGAPLPGIAQTAPYLASNGTGDEGEDDSLQPVAVVSALELRSGACGGAEGQQQLKLVLQRLHGVSPTEPLPILLDKLLDAVLEIFPQAERSHVLLVQQPGGRLELRASKQRMESNLTQMTLGPVSQNIAKRVIARGEALLIGSDEESDSVLVGDSPSSMCAPLLGPSRTPLGILHVDAGMSAQPFISDDLNVMVSIGMIAGQAIEYAQLLGTGGP